MRVAYLAAGAAGMYCGSCIHDNTAASALQRLGHDVVLVPTYTPLRTDEDDVSIDQVFYGAINVYLQQKVGLFRHTPRLLDWLLDRPRLISWAARMGASSTDAEELGELTLAVLQGEHGPQRKELDRLTDWLADEVRPELVHVTNSLLLGLVHRLRERLGVPVVVAFQGEDLFIDQLPPAYRDRIVAEMRRRAADVDRFVAPSRYYAEHMAALLGVATERVAVVPLGINLDGHGATPQREPIHEITIGFLGRVCPEKGLHLLVEAFRLLLASGDGDRLRLRAAGYLGDRDRQYLEALRRKIDGWGIGHRFEYVGEVDLAGKIDFLSSLDVFSMPTVYAEAKGLPVLEALANGVPVVLPRHGSFPELVEATGGGLLVEPHSPEALATGLAALVSDAGRRRELGDTGRAAVRESFDDETMARRTLEVYADAVERFAA